jgi:hypothetical protein
VATHSDVLTFLRPNGGYVAYGLHYEGIQFLDCEPFTKAEYESAFDEYDAWTAEQAEAKATAKVTAQAKLAALGLTVEDLTALGL